MFDRLVFRKPESVIQSAKEQRLRWRAIRFLDHLKTHLLPLRLLQNQLGNVKKRVSPARHANLPRQRFNALFIRQNGQRQLGRGSRLLPLDRAFAAFARAAPSFRAVLRTTAFWPRPLPVKVAARRAAAWLTFPVLARRPVIAGKAGVLIDGGRTLRPSRQKELFQVKLRFWRCAAHLICVVPILVTHQHGRPCRRLQALLTNRQKDLSRQISCSGMRLQIWRKTLNRDCVGLFFCFSCLPCGGFKSLSRHFFQFPEGWLCKK